MDENTSPDTSVDDYPVWLTPKEAAKFLGVSVSWVNQARFKSSDKGPPFRKFGGNVRYLRDDLLEYIDAIKVTPGAR